MEYNLMEYNLMQYTDLLFTIAVKKCENVEDAKDLCQETFLAALCSISNGKEIRDIKSWLVSVLNRKFYDLLRYKYKLPTVSIELIADVMEEEEILNFTFDSEAEDLRRQIAYLSYIHREVIVRYYMKGESVESISKSLSIPKGTVKSRLSVGRSQIKKGFDTMDSYGKQSYEPQKLYVSISGIEGIGGEPYSILEQNLIMQNLLILAYDEPVTEAELAKAIGIPTAYIENLVVKLVDNQLMKRINSKVYTDFIVYSHLDIEKSILPQISFVEAHFQKIWSLMERGLDAINEQPIWNNVSERIKTKFQYYFLMHLMTKCFFGVGGKIYGNDHDYPDRPNGGKWLAMGSSFPMNYDHDNDEFHKYCWSGERINQMNHFLGSKEICLRVFDTPLEKKRYYHTKPDINDDTLAKMLFIIHEKLELSETGFDPLCFKSIPHLVECGILSIENNRPIIDIPILSKKTHEQYLQIADEIAREFIHETLLLFRKYLNNAGLKIPKHLDSVPEHRKYFLAMNCLHMAVINLANEKGFIFSEVNYPFPPMILVVDKEF